VKIYEANTWATLASFNPILTSVLATKPSKKTTLKDPIQQVNNAKKQFLFVKRIHHVILFTFLTT